ncbi:MAG: FeoA family protein [Terrisporobacter othiniensis]|uniref:Ferrous iron transport protein A n=2 Tax=Terrisporobacter TaxID=1505652 RepID=A0AAX2ZII2_9FIRM|nr:MULTISPECIES: FeoA family protein [Terrisporobacter]MBN9647229.1 ferrous iron transport protein A [Terrisporobacter glycolicus]MDU4860329.1 FeoA family protein [Terrisporobacter othiniensis]MCC3862817.1 ferrous iron transport protein A [Terrisporobacter petrolearius]MDU6993442.1 FeoA family protein [Terrisporobacter othiniensis]UEL48595.1 ferrous iron transport protein A [Terrisporobacter hibernicus]
MKTLRDLSPGQKGKVTSLGEKGPSRRRLMDMGITPGVEIQIVKVAPLGDPIEVNLRGYELSLRKDEANQIIVNQL